MRLGLGLGLCGKRLKSLGFKPFIIEVKTDNAGTSNNNQFQFTGAEGNYNVIAKQGNVIVQTFNDLEDEETITLPSAGIYDLEVFPKASNGFNRIRFNDSGDKNKITDIKQWGTVVWSSFEESFDSCSNLLATATDAPDLSNVTSLKRMFRFCTKVEPDTTNWDVSSVTNMERMFNFASNCNPNVFLWDVSQVTDMDLMFRFATKANPNARNWNVSNVSLMENIFDNISLSVENLTLIYQNWSQLNLQQNVSFSAGNTKYNASGQAGRDVMTNTFNWGITDGGQV